MEYPGTKRPARRKNSHLGLIIVISTLAVLMLILIVAVGMFLYSTEFSAASSDVKRPLIGQRTLAMLDVGQVDPAMALAGLGGVPEGDVVIEALSKARPETALSALLFSPVLSDKESAGDFLRLGSVYAGSGAPDKARFSYQMAATIATLSPTMPDTVRSDVFLQASEGLIRVNEPELANFYLDQGYMLALRSPFLQAIQRRTIFERLHKNYLLVGQRELARKSLDLSANPPALISPAKENVILPSPESVPLSAAGQEAEARRWIAAQELAARLVERGGRTPQAALDNLREALVYEDSQKLPFYAAESATTTQLSRKIDITVAQIEWLSIKYRVARQGYGLSLVPEWEAQAEEIRADLTKSYEKLFALYADLIVALPEASRIDKATEEKLRREILAGELGRYPNYPEEQRRKQLLDATNQLIITQPDLQVFITSSTASGQELYTLISPN